MKKFLPVLILLFCFSALNAQDIIVLRDATEIEATILEVTDAQISYKRFDNPNGPVYKKSTADVFYVKYANGTKDVFTVTAAKTNQETADNPKKHEKKKETLSNDSLKLAELERPYIKKPMFDGYAEGILDFGEYFGLGAKVSLGCRVNDYIYAGLLTGMQYFSEYGLRGREMIVVPFQFDCRALFPMKKNNYYYLNIAFGPGLGIREGVWYTPCFLVGTGFDIKRFTIGVGYEYFYRGGLPHYGFVRLGARLGKIN